jgi:hypothetical protein
MLEARRPLSPGTDGEPEQSRASLEGRPARHTTALIRPKRT